MFALKTMISNVEWIFQIREENTLSLKIEIKIEVNI